MRAIKGQVNNLRKNIKQNNIKPLLIVFWCISYDYRNIQEFEWSRKHII